MIESKGFDLAVENAKDPYSAFSSIIDLVKQLLKLADVCAYKDQIITLANSAIDKAVTLADVAINIPYIPAAFEKAAWEFAAKAAKMQVQALVMRVCP